MSTRTWAPGWSSPSGGAPEQKGRGRPDGAAAHSIPLGRIAGIRLQVHWTFLFLLALVVVAGWAGGISSVVAGLAWIGVLFACVVLHELAHCVVARRRGGTVLGILLLPIGGMSRMDRLPSAPGDEAAIAAAGPATSFAIGGLALAVGALLGSAVWPPTMFAGSWLARIGWLNLALGAFNLLPALPMDGGRVLRATLARHRSKLQATRIAAAVARVLAVGLVVAGVFYDFWLVVIGIFVYLGATGEEAQARTEAGPRGGWAPPGWAQPGQWGPPPGWGPSGTGATSGPLFDQWAPGGSPPAQAAWWHPSYGWVPVQPPYWPPPRWQPPLPDGQGVEGDPPPPPVAIGSGDGRYLAVDVPVEDGGGDAGDLQTFGERVRQDH